MGEQFPQTADSGDEGALGDLELGAEQAGGVKGGAEPPGGPRTAEPIAGGKKPPIDG